MELVCGLVLAVVSVAAGSLYPGGLGVKTGAAAKAEAIAVSGAFGGLPNPAVLSAAGGGVYSSSFSKASASSFASSSAGASSYSYSGGFSGALPGGTYNIGGGAGCGSGESCQHRAGTTSGSGAYSGSIPIGAALTGLGFSNTGTGASSYPGSGAAGIPVTGSNYAVAGSVSNLFPGSKPTGPFTSGINQEHVGDTSKVYPGTAPAVNPFSVSSQNTDTSQNARPPSQITSSVSPGIGSDADSAASSDTQLTSGSEFNSKHPTETNKGPCRGDCSNIGSKCKGTSCDSADSKCTSSHCGSTPVSELSSAYNTNNIPVSVLNTNTHTSGSDDLPPNKNINKFPSTDTNSGSKCNSPNCDNTAQPTSGNPYDGQYTSYNPKPNAADLSVYGGQPHKCSSPSCIQASQYGPNLSTQSEPQFIPLAPATHLTAPKEAPKETMKCDTLNCEKKFPDSNKNSANIPVAIHGSPRPHNIYPELTPSKGSPCGLANCDNQGNVHSSVSGNALPLTPTYSYDHKPSGTNCGLSGCGSSNYAPSGGSSFPSSSQGSPSSNSLPGNSYFPSKPQESFPSGSVSGSSYYPSNTYGSTTPGYASTGSHFPTNSQSLSPSKPATGSSYFPPNLQSTSPSEISHFPLSSQGSTPSVYKPDTSYFPSNSQTPLPSSSVPSGQGTVGSTTAGYTSTGSQFPTNSQSLSPSKPATGSSYFPPNLQSTSPSEISHFPLSSQGSTPSVYKPGTSYFPSNSQTPLPSSSVPSGQGTVGSTTAGYTSTGSQFPTNSQSLSPSKPATGSSYFPPNLQSTSPSEISHFPLSSQGSTPSVYKPDTSYFPSSSQTPLPSSSVSSGQGTVGCGQTGICGNYPSSSSNSFGTAGTSGSHTAVKPIVNPDNKSPTYTGGFGAPAGFLKPNEYSLPTKPAYVTPQQSVDKPNHSIPPAVTSQPSFVTGTSVPGIPSSHYNPSTQTIKPVIPFPVPVMQNIAGSSVGAIAGASAVAYTGGFGGPPGFLKPYDNGAKATSFPNYIGNAGSSISGANNNQGPSAAGTSPHSGVGIGSIPPFGRSLAVSGAIATAGAGVNAGTPNGYYGKQSGIETNPALDVATGHGGCTSGCGSRPSGLSGGASFGSNGGISKTGLFDGVSGGQSAASAAAKGFSNAATGSGGGAFGAGGSFASSSAHASAGVGTKGGYGKR